MTRLADLPILASQPRLAQPKPITRLANKLSKNAAFDRGWERTKAIVNRRDEMRCRVCGCRTLITLELTARRAEHHHLVRRAKAPELLTDPRNVLLVCCACHEKLTHHELEPVQRASDLFTLDGKRCLNADRPTITFVKMKGKI